MFRCANPEAYLASGTTQDGDPNLSLDPDDQGLSDPSAQDEHGLTTFFRTSSRLLLQKSVRSTVATWKGHIFLIHVDVVIRS